MTELYLRRAQKSDVNILYEWANETECRKQSFSSEPIAYESHVQWLEQTLKDETVQMYIVMSDEIPVGQIRLNINENQAVISYSLDCKHRGMGYGTSLLELAEHVVKETNPKVNTLIGKVKKDNGSSQKCFKENGYEKREKEDCYEYVKSI